MKKIIWLFAMTVFFLLPSGCSSDGDGKEARQSLIKTTQPAPIELNDQEKDKSVAYQVREDVKKINEIYDVAVIEGKKKILVVYKVRHLQRFKMKKIEKNLQEKLKEKYPDKKFIVSSDYKIFLETIRLKEEMEKENITVDEAKKRFKKIIKLKKEMT
ncbi:YhcN/YlaJ family sporulation lipoprotein [Lederbergia sp. NSJ-179]|nr:YhcN/YlaJ family sporulation lipoprotein [Lederbergia sp. NSJ-179]